MNRIFSFLLVLFIVISCQEKETSVDKVLITPTPNSAEIVDLFKIKEVIQLSGKEIPLGVYRALVFRSDYIFLDQNKEIVWKSNKKGSVRKLIHSVGGGPGEYQEIWDLSVNPKNGELIILDRKSSKLLFFLESGLFKKELPIKKEYVNSISSFFPLSEDEILFFTQGTSGYKFIHLKVSSGVFEFKVPIEKELQGLDFGNDKSMSVFNDRVTIIYPVSHKLERFNFSLDKIDDVFLDFDQFSILAFEVQALQNDQNQLFEMIQNDEEKKAHSFSVVEIEDYYFLDYYLGSFRQGDFMKTLINKSTGVNLSWKSLTIDGVEANLNLLGTNEKNDFVFLFNPEELEKFTSMQVELLSKVLGVSIDQNHPLILIMSPK